MSEIIRKHLEAVESRDIAAVLEDYAKDVVGVVNFDGKSKTLDYGAVKQIIETLFVQNLVEPVTDGSKNSTILQENVENYGVIALPFQPVTDFLAYTCIVKDGKIAYVTICAGKTEKSAALFIESRKFPRAKQAKKIFFRHLIAMFTRNADKITKDYSKDAVVITNLAQKPCNGKEELYSFCSSLMGMVDKFQIKGIPRMKLHVKDAAGELIFLSFYIKAPKMYGTETYLIRDGEILFESSVFGGDVPDLY